MDTFLPSHYHFRQGESSGMEEVANSNCKSIMRIQQEDVAQLPKSVEGILVGGNILVIIFSSCGNIAALIIVLRSKAPKLSTKYFLTFLAISDLLLTASAPPFEIGKLLDDYNSWIFGELLCKLVPSLQLVAATMSAICLMAIAVERNLLIVRTMSSPTANIKWDTWIAPVIGVAVILLPLACGLPNLWYYQTIPFIGIPRKPNSGGSDISTTEDSGLTSSTTITPTPAEPNRTCHLRHYCFRSNFDRKNIIYYSVTGSTYLCLLLCFLMCYVSIYRFVKKHGNFKNELKQQQYSSREPPANITPHETKLMTVERHRKTLRLILGLILLNICCRFPNWLLLVIINVVVVPTTDATLTLLECLHLLSSVNSALNPFLYVIWNHSLRATSDRDVAKPRYRWWKDSGCSDRVNHAFHSVVSCCRYKRGDIGRQATAISSDPAMIGKGPNVYNVRNSENNNVIPSISTQCVVYSDKSVP